jgi:prolyl oligopeptidase
VREFDAVSKSFVDGFRLPESKGSVDWVDANTLIIARDFGPGTLTTSGYPRQVRLWKRGTPVTAAPIIMEIPATDMGVWGSRVETATAAHTIISHSTDFYTANTYLLVKDKPVRLDVPHDASTHFVRDQLVVYVRSPWAVGGATYDMGSLIAIPLADFLAGRRSFTRVLVPGAREAVMDVSATRSHLLVTMLDNVRGELRRFTPADGSWRADTVPAPEVGTVSVVATSPSSDRFFFTFSGFTQPETLYLGDSGSTREMRRLPAMFNADGLAVEQREALSKDGTRIPYFVVSREGAPRDGTSPTLLNAYGGFEVPRTAAYSAITGVAWLERGGTFVLANIRGGGEFGPQWHRAGLKENRQRVYDDFIAVAEDIIRIGITSPAHLGIMGGSNGGLLVGVAFTQRPDLFGAVVSQVPLLDMQRYSHLLAGASWMAEYGNPDIPAEWAYISRYSPYHNLHAATKYPRVLFTTTTRDDRVHPGHARKMAAKMEDMGLPFLYFENTEGGHGAGVTSEQRAKSYGLTYTYLWEQLKTVAF